MKLTKPILLFLTLACGFSAANIYYNQTLFVLIGKTFGYGVEKISFLSTVTQIAYACGLLFFVPLADMLCRKTLISSLFFVNALMQMLCALAPSYMVLLVGSFFIGISTVAAQIIIPAVTLISDESQRGKNVGLLLSGLFTGVVFARMLSGFVGHYFGWRDVYWMSAGIDMLIILGVLVFFPEIHIGKKMPYLKLLGSLTKIITSESTLRRSSLYGALIFCAFSGMWGALDYLLSSKPYFYTSNIVGLFALIGVFGVLSSRIIGGVADKHGVNVVLKLIPLSIIIGFACISLAAMNLLFLILGMIVLDISSRASLISNQLVNYTLGAEVRSRVNTIFMCFYFVGGSIGTSIGSTVAVGYGWPGLACFGGLCAILTFLVQSRRDDKK